MVTTENSSTAGVAESTNTSVLIVGILGAVLLLVVVMTCIIFCYIKWARKTKVDL